MSDTRKEVATMFTERAETLPTLLGKPARRDSLVPASEIRERRGNRSQVEIAQAAGISQSFLSELESGQKRLTPDMAQRLAPALGTTADQLVLGEHLARLNRATMKGKIDPQPLLDEAKRLTEILPGGEVGDAIVDALVGIVRERPKLLT